MIQIRRSAERGHAEHGWLNSFHSFSFADYYDPKHMGFRSLRVLNEDRVAPGRGFGLHGHRDMEILSYVIDGSLAHKDNMGHEEVLGPDEIQRMSAGTGIMHSEFNPSQIKGAHFLQIWIEPATTDTRPSYEQIRFERKEKRGKWKLLAGPESGAGIEQMGVAKIGAATINQDARVMVTELENGEELRYAMDPRRYGWVQVIRGNVAVNGHALSAGDAAALSEEPEVSVSSLAGGEVLLFDLA